MSSEANDEPRAHYVCGKCGLKWDDERTTQPVGCPKCGNYSMVGVDGATAAALAPPRRR